jgi:hypothetical protein
LEPRQSERKCVVAKTEAQARTNVPLNRMGEEVAFGERDELLVHVKLVQGR